MSILREVLARFGIEVDDSALKGLSEGIDKLIGQMRKFAGVAAIGWAVRALHNFTVEMAAAGDEIGKASQRLGVGTDTLQAWRHAAGGSEEDAQLLGSALQTLQRNAEAVSRGQGPAQAFRTLGVAAREADGSVRDLESMFPDLLDAFQGVENHTQAAALAVQVFGTSGQRLLPFLQGGSAGLERLTAEFRALGGGGTEDFVRLSSELNEQMTRLDLAVFSLKSRLATVLLPIFIRATEVTTKVVSEFMRLAETSHVIQSVMLLLGAAAIVLGVKFAIAFAAPLAIGAAVAIAIAFLVLLVDDLITLFSGGQSVIGGFVDELFGVGTAAQLILDLREAWEGVVLSVRRASFAVRDFFGQTEEGETMPTASGRSDVLTPDQMFDRQARTAAESGRIMGRPGEDREAALARFRRFRQEGIEDGRIESTQEDVEDGLAPRVGFRGSGVSHGVDREGRAVRGALRREATVPRRGEGGRRTSVDARTTATIQVAPGTDRRQLEALRRAVGGVMDERNRAAAAALGEESLEGEED